MGKLHVIAYSMGGLDMRHALLHEPIVSDRVATLMTIGTPHKGSLVADAIVAHSGALFTHCPALVLEQLKMNSAGLHDLTTFSVASFNAITPDVPGVRYIAVAGNAAAAGHELLLFQFAAVLGHETGQINDGVVTRDSALRDGYERMDDWPTDHAGEIGWTFPPIPLEIPPPGLATPHFDRYDDILRLL
jgi:triacylglycerol lipase